MLLQKVFYKEYKRRQLPSKRNSVNEKGMGGKNPDFRTDNADFAGMSDDELDRWIVSETERLLAGEQLTIGEKAELVDQVYSSIRGFGLLDSILKDDDITEVMINGPKEIFIEKAGRLKKLDEKFESEEKLVDIIRKIVGLAGREVSEANPIVDTRLPDGSRVNVVMPPISLKGPIVTIRKFSKKMCIRDRLDAMVNGYGYSKL